MKKNTYWIIASYDVGSIEGLSKRCLSQESVTVEGEDLLQYCINDFVSRKLKKLSFRITKLTKHQIENGIDL